MARPAPKTITSDLIKDIYDLADHATSYCSDDDFSIQALRRKATKLFNANAREAYFCHALIDMLRGDFDAACTNVEKSRALNAYHNADDLEWQIASNLGHFSHAAAILERLAKVEHPSGLDVCRRINCGLLCGFSESMAPAKPQTIDGNPFRHSLVEIAMKAAHVMPKIGVSDQDVTAMLDIAGEVLREHKLFWLREHPIVRVVDAGSASSILYQYVIGASLATVVDLTEEVAARLMEREMDRPGLLFSFLPEVDSEGRPRVA